MQNIWPNIKKVFILFWHPILTTITPDKALDWSVDTLGHELTVNFTKKFKTIVASNYVRFITWLRWEFI